MLGGVWEVPPRLTPVLVFPAYIFHFLSNLFIDWSGFKVARKMPLSFWSCVCHGRFQLFSLDTFLAVYCTATCVRLWTSGIRHQQAGRGLFAASLIGKCRIVGKQYVLWFTRLWSILYRGTWRRGRMIWMWQRNSFERVPTVFLRGLQIYNLYSILCW